MTHPTNVNYKEARARIAKLERELKEFYEKHPEFRDEEEEMLFDVEEEEEMLFDEEEEKEKIAEAQIDSMISSYFAGRIL